MKYIFTYSWTPIILQRGLLHEVMKITRDSSSFFLICRGWSFGTQMLIRSRGDPLTNAGLCVKMLSRINSNYR